MSALEKTHYLLEMQDCTARLSLDELPLRPTRFQVTQAAILTLSRMDEGRLITQLTCVVMDVVRRILHDTTHLLTALRAGAVLLWVLCMHTLFTLGEVSWFRSHISMASRSYVWPSAAITGSRISSRVMGQENSSRRAEPRTCRVQKKKKGVR